VQNIALSTMLAAETRKVHAVLDDDDATVQDIIDVNDSVKDVTDSIQEIMDAMARKTACLMAVLKKTL